MGNSGSQNGLSPELAAASDQGPSKQVRQADRGDKLQLATVTAVNYEDFVVTLRIGGLTPEAGGTETPITFPGFGNRGILGRMPEPGDICVCASLAETSGFKEGAYVIVGWVVQAPSEGHDWLPTWGFDPENEKSPSPRTLTEAGGEHLYIRRKLRHMTPGSIVASSSQGSDLILDEDVLLANRRANEIRLRDSDQAIVMRSLQQFHTMAGVRVYSGIVQRDSALVPLEMITDEFEWDAPIALLPFDGNTPFRVGLVDAENKKRYPPFSETSKASYVLGGLLPHPVFQQLASDKKKLVSGLILGTNGVHESLDPFTIYSRAGFIDQAGFINTSIRTLTNSSATLIYGGKSYHRVTSNSYREGGLSSKPVSLVEQGLTEHRIEVSYTSDGTLPVSEQTEMFDIDRSDEKFSRPFVEVVYGSVVGNDPFSELASYARPLSPSAQSILPANPSSDVGDHAATLLRVRPSRVRDVISTSLVPPPPPPPDAFISITKDGRAFFKFTGFSKNASVEGTLQNGAILNSGKLINFRSSGGFKLTAGNGAGDPVFNRGVQIISEDSSIFIQARGQGLDTPIEVAQANRASPRPSLILDADRGLLSLKSQAGIDFVSPSLNFGFGKTINMVSSNLVKVESGGTVGLAGASVDISVVGSSNQSFVGPQKGIPTNGPTRFTSFKSSPATGHLSGAVDKTEIFYGDQDTLIISGSKNTTVGQGDIKSSVVIGKVTQYAGLGNSVELDSVSGLETNIKVGDIISTATLGGMSLKAAQDLVITSQFSDVQIQALGSIHLKSAQYTGLPGFLILSTDIDPITGQPFSAYLMGSSAFQVGTYTGG